MDADEVDGSKWEAWNRVLAGLVSQINSGSRRDDETLARLYELAVELRDRLRHSQTRLRSVKHELSVTAASARSERHDSLARLRELETEVARLAGAVQAQGSTLAAREAVARAQAEENEQLRRQVLALQKQMQRVEDDRLATIGERNDALRNLERMTRLLEEAESRVATAHVEHSDVLGELVATKSRLADMSGLETLYGAARDELARLDKENLELKEMVAGGSMTLGRSRILEALGVPDSSDVFISTRAAAGTGSGNRSGATGRSRSAPRTRRPSAAASPGGGILSYGRGAFLPNMVPATADEYRRSRAHSARAPSPGRSSLSHSVGSFGPGALEDPVSDMAFLGPPSSAYPPDPENYVFYRVGGGYAPKLDPLNPTIPQPRASGWVPKDVVRLVQAFRHSYGLSLEWRFWEPLLLMIDEVYRGRVDGSFASMRSAQRERLKTVRRQLRSALAYPSALAHGRIAHLQRQLEGTRRVLAAGDRKGDVALRRMAVKDYHLGAQLDRAVEENHALRSSLAELEELYAAASDGGSGAAAAADSPAYPYPRTSLRSHAPAYEAAAAFGSPDPAAQRDPYGGAAGAYGPRHENVGGIGGGGFVGSPGGYPLRHGRAGPETGGGAAGPALRRADGAASPQAPR